MKTAFLLKNNWIEIFDRLSDKQAGMLIKMLFAYNVNGDVPEGMKDEVVNAYFNMMRLDSDTMKGNYDRRCESSAKNGKLGGAPKGNRNAAKQPKQPKQPKQADHDYEYDYDYENEYEGERSAHAREDPAPVENDFSRFISEWNACAADKDFPVKLSVQSWLVPPDIVIRNYLARSQEYGAKTVREAINRLRRAKFLHGKPLGMSKLLDEKFFISLLEGQYDNIFSTQSKSHGNPTSTSPKSTHSEDERVKRKSQFSDEERVEYERRYGEPPPDM